MTILNDKLLQTIKQMLDRREEDLRADLERESGEKRDLTDYAPEVPDPADASFVNLALDLGNAEMTRDFAELRAIGAARKRMEEGSYGECSQCGNEIPVERLKAQPTAERCAPCQGLYERTHAEVGRGAIM